MEGKKIPIYQVDAFTSRLFRGNPAAVCPLDEWPADRVMQEIAAENNLSETAFFVRSGEGYDLRWFTPEVEVDLCGHATLASAHVIFTALEPDLGAVEFSTQSGPVRVLREGARLTLDFPSRPPAPGKVPEGAGEALGAEPDELLLSRDLFAVYPSQERILSLEPDMDRLAALHPEGIIVTAPGDEVDFVSRFFAPAMGVPEDPVTGSAHCTLVPYWARRLERKRLHALQVSKRGGELFCEDRGDRVRISGEAVTYLEGTLLL